MLIVFLILNQFVISITFLSACVIRYTYLTEIYYVKIDQNYSLLLVCLSIHTLSVSSWRVKSRPNICRSQFINFAAWQLKAATH